MNTDEEAPRLKMRERWRKKKLERFRDAAEVDGENSRKNRFFG